MKQKIIYKLIWLYQSDIDNLEKLKIKLWIKSGSKIIRNLIKHKLWLK